VRILALMYLAACSGQGSSTPAAPEAIEVRDGNRVIARVVPGHPCRADIDGVAVQVGGPPLVAQVGDTSWTGEDGSNGTTIFENGAYVARLYRGNLFDGRGVAIMRVYVSGTTAEIKDAGGNPIGGVGRNGDGITGPHGRVTGTDDLNVAALLTAGETRPEIRALAACRQLFGGTNP
jgi:hypothetical protein